jgi:PilZ domain
LDTHDQATPGLVRDIFEKRGQPRFKLEVDITITSRTRGLFKGYTVDISESGISAIMAIAVPLGEVVELGFTLPIGPVRVYAVVRQKSAFRHSFQFIESDSMKEVIQRTCRDLAVKQSLFDEVKSITNER